MTLAFIVGLQAEATLLRGLDMPIFIGGGGASGAAAAVQRAREAGATSLISFGLAGGLDPLLPAGACLVPRQVLWRGVLYGADPALGMALGGFNSDILLAGDTVLARVADKQAAYRASEASAVDLESGPVAASGLKFAVWRAVCDPAGRDLPPAALAALDSAGVIGLGRVLASLLRHPAQIGDLLGLARDAARARRALAEEVSGSFLKKRTKKLL